MSPKINTPPRTRADLVSFVLLLILLPTKTHVARHRDPPATRPHSRIRRGGWREGLTSGESNHGSIPMLTSCTERHWFSCFHITAILFFSWVRVHQYFFSLYSFIHTYPAVDRSFYFITGSSITMLRCVCVPVTPFSTGYFPMSSVSFSFNACQFAYVSLPATGFSPSTPVSQFLFPLPSRYITFLNPFRNSNNNNNKDISALDTCTASGLSFPVQYIHVPSQ